MLVLTQNVFFIGLLGGAVPPTTLKLILSINDKAILASNVLNYALGDGTTRFINPLQVEVYTVILVI